MVQAKVICCRSSDGDFLLEKSGRSPIAKEIHLKFAGYESLSEDCRSERSDFMRNPTEGHPTVEFGWCYGGSSIGGVLGTLEKVECWRSLKFNSIIEVRTESDSCRSLKGGCLL